MVTRIELKTNAKRNIRDNVLTLFFINFLVSAPRGPSIYWNILNLRAFSTIYESINEIQPGNYLVGLMMVLIFVLIYPALLIGQKKTYLENARGEKAGLKYIMSGFYNYGNSILLYILMSVFTFLWSLLFAVPGIMKFLSYSMAPYILAENPEMSALEAINLSKKMMDGRKWELFTLCLSFFWWILLHLLTFGLAGIYVGPYMEATFANFYIELKNNKK